MSNIERNKKVVREFTRIFKNQHNVDGIDHLFAPDFRHNFKVPLSPGLKGLKEVGVVMNTAFPDVVVTENDMIADERTVVERSSAAATNAGPYMNYPATGKKINWTEIHIYRLNDAGKIMEHWAEISTLELMLQIGAARMYGSASDLIVIASAKAQAGEEKVLEQALFEAAGPTRLQPGCVSFSLYQAVDDPTVIVGFEVIIRADHFVGANSPFTFAMC